MISETWLTDGESLEEDIEGLVLGISLKMIYKNRPPNARGFSHGGMAVVYKESALNLKQVELVNPDGLEIILVTGSLRGCPRKIAVVACYIPPTTLLPKQEVFLSSWSVPPWKQRERWRIR